MAWREYDVPRAFVLLGQRSDGEGAVWFLVGRRGIVRALAIFGAFCEYWSGVKRNAMESYDGDTKVMLNKERCVGSAMLKVGSIRESK